MATQLKNILSFLNLLPGVPTALPHLLNKQGVPYLPDIITIDEGFDVVATDTLLTVTNVGLDSASTDVLVEEWHSFERAFGASATVDLTPKPYIVRRGRAPGTTPSGTPETQCIGDGLVATSLNVYIDGAVGSDNNSGLFPGALGALKELHTAWFKFPKDFVNGCRIVVNIAGSGVPGVKQFYTERVSLLGGGEGLNNSYVYRGPAMTPKPLATGPNTSIPLDVIPAVAVGKRTRFDFTAAAPGWTVQNLRGAYIRIMRGPDLVVAETPISENTASTLFVDVTDGLAAAILSTDTVDIVSPAVVISGPFADANFGVTTILGTSSFSDIGFGLITPGQSFERIEFGFILAAGVEGLAFDRCLFEQGGEIRGGSCQFVQCVSLGTMELEGISGADFAPFPRQETATSPLNPSINFGMLHVDGGRWLLRPGSFLAFWNTSVYDEPFGNPAIEAVGPGSYFQADDTFGVGVTTVAIQGSGNAGVAIHARDGAQIRVNPGAFTTITGTGDPLKVAKGAAIPYGAGVGAFEEVLGYNGNFTRMLEGTATHPISDTSRIFTP